MATPRVLRTLTCLGCLALPGLAYAGDVETWIGGAASGGVEVGADGAGGIGVAPFSPQAELDARLGTDLIYVRLDLDAHFGIDGTGNFGLVSPIPPEWAMVQIGREKYHLRLGVTNPNIGLQQWEEWQNYLPGYSLLWAAQPSQILGVEPGIDFEDGTSLFVYGGYDLGWGGIHLKHGAGGGAKPQVFTPEGATAGVGVSRSADSYYVALDVSAYPLGSLDYYCSFLTFELYPTDILTLSLDGGGGTSGGSSFVGGQLQVVLAPSDVVSPVVRVEGLYDPDGFLGEPMATASVGGRVMPLEFLTVGVEGKSSFYDGSPAQLSGIVLLSVFRPEPDVYAASYEESE